MKNRTTFLKFSFAVAVLAATTLVTRASDKNEPDDVGEMLQNIGGKHYVEDMKVNDVGSVKVKNDETDEETYYHVYSAYVDPAYRVIIFDNTPRYLGYYEVNYEPTDYEEGTVLLDAGDGESYFRIRLPFDGPSDQIAIDGVSSEFVKNEAAENAIAAEAEAKAAAVAAAEAKANLQPEYREWTLRLHGQEYTFRAIYVKTSGPDIFLKDEERGITKDFHQSSFLLEDLEYIKQFED